MIGHILDGRYRVIALLGAGGFGQTYVAENTRLPGNPKCVIKQLKPASTDPNSFVIAKRLFESEAAALVKLGNHNQIPRITDFFAENQEFYLVQDFIEGQTLTKELAPGQKLDETYVIAILNDILPILEFVHQQNTIHRDIKPDNIIRRQEDNKLVLIDFGAVKEQVQALTTVVESQQSTPSIAIGTPGYMPTEQGRGKPRPSSDIYALGMIGIQALTGVYPGNLEEDSRTGEIIWQHLTSVSSELAEVLTKMTRYHFKDRYQSATEVLQTLKQLENKAPAQTRIPSFSTYQKTQVVTDIKTDIKIDVYELTLEWVEAGRTKTQIISEQSLSKNPGTIRIGRDPAQCDIVLSEPTVSGLHVEIFFSQQQHQFWVRNLRESNPPVVNGIPLLHGQVALSQSSVLQLGVMELKVAAITVGQSSTSAKNFQSTKHFIPQASLPVQAVAPTIEPQQLSSPATSNDTNLSQSQTQIWRCIQTLTGHAASVRSVAFSPDGQTIATGSDDNTIKLWHIGSGTLTRTFNPQSGLFQREATWFTSIAISSDGQTLVSGSLDKSIKLWQTNSGNLIRNFKAHSDSIHTIAISLDGQIIVSGSRDNTIKVWNLPTGKLLRTLTGHADLVHSVALSRNGQMLVSGSRDNTIKVWNLLTGKLERTFTGHLDSVRAVAISPDGNTLASASNDKTIQLWHISNGTMIHNLTGHTDWVTGIAISPDGNTLISGSRDKNINLWQLSTGKLIGTLTEHSESLCCVTFSPDGKTIASSSDDGIIKLWQLA